MSRILGRWTWPAVGASAIGVAVGAGTGSAEPIKEPLTPSNVSAPRGEAPVAPAGVTIPAIPSIALPAPTVPSEPAPPVVAPPAIETPVLPLAPTLPAPEVDLAPAPHPFLKEPQPAPVPKPVIPAIPAVAPHALPAKSAEPTQPAATVLPDSPLRLAPKGLTLNSESVPAKPEVTPVPRPVTPPPVTLTAIPTPPPTLPEDPPMTLAPRQFAMSAALGLALASAPLSPVKAAEADEVKATDVEAMKKEMAALKADIEKLKNFRNDTLDSLLGKTVDGKTVDGLYGRMSNLETRFGKVESSLTRIEEQLNKLSKSTSSFSPQPQPMTSTRGFVKLVNDYPVEVSIVLNGKSHRMTPGEVKTVEVPVGSYTYELLTAGAQPTTSTVRDAETVTLRIR